MKRSHPKIETSSTYGPVSLSPHHRTVHLALYAVKIVIDTLDMIKPFDPFLSIRFVRVMLNSLFLCLSFERPPDIWQRVFVGDTLELIASSSFVLTMRPCPSTFQKVCFLAVSRNQDTDFFLADTKKVGRIAMLAGPVIFLSLFQSTGNRYRPLR